MGWQILPVRNSPDDPVADDYLIWSDNVDAPLFRGTKAECMRHWRRWETQGRHPRIAHFVLVNLFERADRDGTSSALGDRWGEEITCYEVPNGPGVLPRERLREFADLMFPGYPDGPEVVRSADIDADAVGALLEPFEDDEEPDDENEDR